MPVRGVAAARSQERAEGEGDREVVHGRFPLEAVGQGASEMGERSDHAPVTTPGYEDALAMVREIDRPNLRLCLDAPLFYERQSDAYVREESLRRARRGEGEGFDDRVLGAVREQASAVGLAY